jgi:hypothetical protein
MPDYIALGHYYTHDLDFPFLPGPTNCSLLAILDTTGIAGIEKQNYVVLLSFTEALDSSQERMLDDLKTPEPTPTIRSNGETATNNRMPVRFSPMTEKILDFNNGTPNTSKLQMKLSPATETLKLVKVHSSPQDLQGDDSSKERKVGSKLDKLASFVKAKSNSTSEVAGKEGISGSMGNEKHKTELKLPINPFARAKKV